MIKMVVSDIDGTIYTPETGISSEVKNCIQNLEKKGIKFVLATGRTYASAKYMADLTGVKCPLIAYQGALVCSYEGRILDSKYLDAASARKITADFRKRGIHLNVYVNDTLYVENDDEYIKDYIGDKGIDYFKAASFDDLDFSKLNKMLAIKYDEKFIDDLILELRNTYPEIYTVKSFKYFCEIADKNVSKGNAVKFLASMYGIKEEEILAIGDQNNDIEMIKTAGIGIAMGNGTPEIKAQADYITDTVQNNGFVKAVQKFTGC